MRTQFRRHSTIFLNEFLKYRSFQALFSQIKRMPSSSHTMRYSSPSYSYGEWKQSVNKQIFAFAERNNQPFKILLFLLRIFSSLITNTMYSQQELYFWHLKEVILDVLKVIHIFKWLFSSLYLLSAPAHWRQTRSKYYHLVKHQKSICWVLCSYLHFLGIYANAYPIMA